VRSIYIYLLLKHFVIFVIPIIIEMVALVLQKK